MNRLTALTASAAVGLASCSGKATCDSCGDDSPSVTLVAPQGPPSQMAPNPCELDLDFGSVAIGASDTATIRFQRVSGLDVSQLQADLDPEFGVAPAPQNAPGTSDLTVTFQPYKNGRVQSGLTIATDGVNPACPAPQPPGTTSSLTVTLTGTAFQAGLVVQPNVLDFGDTLVYSTAKKSVTLINQSSAAVTGITATVGGGDENLFTIDHAPTSLDANSSAVVDISYAPLALETRARANVIFQGADGEKATANLFGEPVGIALSFGPNPIDFGYVPLLSAAIGCTTASNQSNVQVDIQSAIQFNTAGGAFAVAATDDSTPPVAIDYPLTIAGGASQKICFSFTPQIAQQYNGQVTLRSNEPSGSDPVLQLTGWGGGPQISCSSTGIDFGETLDHAVFTVPVICTNTGTAIPTTNLMIIPPNASPYVFTATFDQSHDPYPLPGLAPGQSAQIDVSYAPTATSIDKGTLFVKSNGGRGTTLQIPLAGQGLSVPACQFVLSPTSIDFATVALGDTSAAFPLQIQNVGSDICLVQGLRIKNDLTGSFHLLSTSIEPDASSSEITIPAADAGVASSLSVSLDFEPTLQAPSMAAELVFTISDPSAPNQIVLLKGASDSN